MLTDKENAKTIHLFSAVEVLFHFGLCFPTAVSPFVPASRLPCQGLFPKLFVVLSLL